MLNGRYILKWLFLYCLVVFTVLFFLGGPGKGVKHHYILDINLMIVLKYMVLRERNTVVFLESPNRLMPPEGKHPRSLEVIFLFQFGCSCDVCSTRCMWDYTVSGEWQRQRRRNDMFSLFDMMLCSVFGWLMGFKF